MKELSTPRNQKEKVDQLHWQSKQWKSNLHFMKDELLFIARLLNSYVFEPNTPNLFERLQEYQQQLQMAKYNEMSLRKLIAKHENKLGGLLECTDDNCDLEYYNKHDSIRVRVEECLEEFSTLKSEIFSYAGGILKMRKPLPKN